MVPVGGFPKLGVSTVVVVKGEVIAMEDFWIGEHFSLYIIHLLTLEYHYTHQ